MLQFESCQFLDDEDASFVSIDLNDDNEECDICHQQTHEPIVKVMLSDEFLRFESSFERTGDRLTKAHQICVERWSSIIERNMKFNNNKQTFSENKLHKKTNIRSNLNECKDVKDSIFTNDQGNNCWLQKKFSLDKLNLMNTTNLKDLIFELESQVTDASNHLVEELQIRDKLCQEISAQKSLIEQLVKLQKNSSSLPKQPSVQTPFSKTSVLV